MTPTLRNSSRSTRGTTRMTAYSNKCGAGMKGLFYKDRGCSDPGYQELSIDRTNLLRGLAGRPVDQPFFRDKIDDLLDMVRGEPVAVNGVDGFDLGCLRQEDVLPDRQEGSGRLLFPVIPGVVEIQSCTVIDQPKLFVPDQHIGIPGGAVDIGQQAIE